MNDDPEDEAFPETPTGAIMDAVKRLDRGDGVPKDDLLEAAGREGFGLVVLQERLNELERRGEVYICDGEDSYRATSEVA